MANSLQPHGLQSTRFLNPWDFLGKNAGVDCISYSRRSSQPRDWTHISCISWIDRQILYRCAIWEAQVHQFSSVQFSCSVVSDLLWPHGLQHTRLLIHHQLLELAQTYVHRVGDTSNHLSSVIPFSSCLQSFLASGSSPVSQFFTSSGPSIGASASASVLPMNIQNWFPLGLIGLIPLQSKGLSRVFSNTTVQKHQFFGAQLSLWSNSHIHTWLLDKP